MRLRRDYKEPVTLLSEIVFLLLTQVVEVVRVVLQLLVHDVLERSQGRPLLSRRQRALLVRAEKFAKFAAAFFKVGQHGWEAFRQRRHFLDDFLLLFQRFKLGLDLPQLVLPLFRFFTLSLQQLGCGIVLLVIVALDFQQVLLGFSKFPLELPPSPSTASPTCSSLKPGPLATVIVRNIHERSIQRGQMKHNTCHKSNNVNIYNFLILAFVSGFDLGG